MLRPVSETRVPPPMAWSRATTRAKTSATTHMPMANWPLRRRRTRSETGRATAAAAGGAVATGGGEGGEAHREVRRDAGLGEDDGGVGAEAEEGLLADRDQAAVAGEGVPHRGEDGEDEQLGELLGGVGRQRERDEGEGDDDDRDARHREPRQPAPALDGVARGRGVDRRHAQLLRAARVRPRGLARTARNTRWPARIEYSGSMWAPTVCATPSTMPPSKVPHSEPKPPMTTASNAKISWVGPLAGSKVERMARKAPARAAVATAIAVARA